MAEQMVEQMAQKVAQQMVEPSDDASAGRGAHTIAVMPLRDGHSGKSRLAAMATPAQRTALISRLAHHVADCLVREERIGRLLVVTNAPDFAGNALPADPKVMIVEQPRERPGLNAAAQLGFQRARAMGAGRVLTMHADLPTLGLEDVAALVEAPGQLVLAPDRLGEGTNALIASGDLSGFAFGFGTASFRAHYDVGRQLGAWTTVVHRDGLALDLDTVDDWHALPADVRRWLGLSDVS